MSLTRQLPVAITGMGLLCRRLDREVRVSALTRKFIWIEDPPAHTPRSGAASDEWHYGRSLMLATEAARWAQGSAITQLRDAGIIVTISKGMTDFLEESAAAIRAGNLRAVPPIGVTLDCAPDAASRAIALVNRMNGPTAAAVAACASGLASVKLGMDWLRDGVCETVLAGAAESSSSELILGSFERLGVLSPSGTTRPFDRKRDGFVIGEGAAVFRLERQSKSTPLAYILGTALAADATHITTPDPNGAMIAYATRVALERAGLSPAEIGWIHAHGTATELNDRAEVAALKSVFGVHVPPVTATKGATGHLLGASGAVALGITLEALRAGVIPPVFGLSEPDPEFSGIDFVMGEPCHSNAKTVLVLNYGFGGHIAAMVVGLP